MDIIHPRLIKDLRKGKYTNLSESDNFLLQKNLRWLPGKENSNPQFRIITRAFPRYKSNIFPCALIAVAADNDLELVQSVWVYLHETIGLPKKLSSTKAVRFIKMSARSDGIMQATLDDDRISIEDSETEDEEGLLYHKALEDVDQPQDDMGEHQLLADSNIKLDSSKHPKNNSASVVDGECLPQPDNAPTTPTAPGSVVIPNDVNSWLNQVNEATGIISALEYTTKDTKWTFEQWKQKYYDSLFLPEQTNSKASKLQYIREKHLVHRRRIALLSLTLYSLFIRYCSFDFFIFLLVVSNFGMLYLLRNSGRINLQMAKRSVKTRVGWAKQYLGELIGGKKAPTVKEDSFSEDKDTGGTSFPQTLTGTSSNAPREGIPKQGILSRLANRRRNTPPADSIQAAALSLSIPHSTPINIATHSAPPLYQQFSLDLKSSASQDEIFGSSVDEKKKGSEELMMKKPGLFKRSSSSKSKTRPSVTTPSPNRDLSDALGTERRQSRSVNDLQS